MTNFYFRYHGRYFKFDKDEYDRRMATRSYGDISISLETLWRILKEMMITQYAEGDPVRQLFEQNLIVELQSQPEDWSIGWQAMLTEMQGDPSKFKRYYQSEGDFIPVTQPLGEAESAPITPGALYLDDLLDVTVTSPLYDCQVLTYDQASSQWVNKQIDLPCLSDVQIQTPLSVGQVLTYNGSQWTNEDLPSAIASGADEAFVMALSGV